MKMFFRKKVQKLVSDSSTANTLVSKAYRFFPIANSQGDLTGQRGWSSSLTQAPKVQLDELGRTTIIIENDGPLYFVSNGTDREFKNLANNSGFKLQGANAVRVSASMVPSRQQRTQIVLLEYDENRQRIGEVTVPATTECLAYLHSATRYVLPTIRVSGSGKLTVNWLRFESAIKQEIDIPGRVQFLNQVQVGPDSQFSGVKQQLDVISDGLKKAQAELSDLVLTHDNTPTAKSNDAVALFRERVIRESLTALAASLPDSNGCRHYEKIPLRVGLITDEYMFNFYRDVFDTTVYLSPSGYKSQLQENDFDLILYVTCWKGMNDEEWKGVKFRETPKTALNAIIDWANENDIPTIFQSIEDPSNFEYFLPIAEKFDHIFTSDSDVVERYQEELRHDRVYYAEYGANPMVNNPIGSWRHFFNRAFFAGSYPERYAERTKDMRTIFDSIPDLGRNLLILDRNFNSTGFDFPEAYQEAIVGPVPHEVLQKMHKLYRYSLNFNSIKNSPTMCAMRVYELQAQGLPIISNYAKSVFNHFPGIRIIPEKTEIVEFETPPQSYQELAVANDLLLEAQLDKNAYEVTSRMVSKTGLPVAKSKPKTVLVFIPNATTSLKDALKDQRFVETFTTSNPEEFETLATSGRFTYGVALSPNLDYEPNYLAGLLAAFVYTDSDFVCQEAYFEEGKLVDGPVHEFIPAASDRFKSMIDLGTTGAVDFLMGRTESLTGEGYAVAPFGIGYSTFVRTHALEQDKPKILSVIVPVYNNGRFLETKCIESIKRNTRWNEFEVLLVDDGSTDPETISICASLQRRYPNIKLYCFNDGGSGSASRPRNKGLELASTEWITYLDPDNEISPQGYDNLLALLDKRVDQDQPCDLVSGYQVKVAERVGYTGRNTDKEARVVENSYKEFFGRGQFPVVSTQAAVIRRSVLKNNDISFVEGAAGQDTLYGWELLHYAKSPIFTNTAYIIYYAERTSSITNSVDTAYFDKSLVLERAQVQSLKKMGLFEEYVESRFDAFIRGWYLEKLRRVPEEHRESAAQTLRKIIDLYGQRPEDYLESVVNG